jgi:hypothetical protein
MADAGDKQFQSVPDVILNDQRDYERDNIVLGLNNSVSA